MLKLRGLLEGNLEVSFEVTKASEKIGIVDFALYLHIYGFDLEDS